MKIRWIFLFALIISASLYAADSTSILTVHQSSVSRIKKDNPQNPEFMNRQQAVASSGQMEDIQYRGYLIKLNRNRTMYEVQVSNLVRYGNLEVNSIYASQFQSSIEYSYSIDGQSGRIRQDHFLFPAGSLTGWGNPDEYVIMARFDWKEKFPTTKNCQLAVYTSEEFGREYLEASCFQDHDSALNFAKKFINYVSTRGMVTAKN